MNTGSTRITVVSASFTALIAIGAYISIPIGPVPVVLQNFFVLLTGLFLPPGPAFSTIAVYLLLGALGIPVFAGGTGGIGHLFGPTGGYLIAYLPAVVLTAVISGDPGVRSTLRSVMALLAGTAILYLVGLPRLKYVTEMTWNQATAAGLFPFLPGDGLKIIAALFVRRSYGPRLKKFLSSE